MKDQHTLIKGYRDLNLAEIDLMNDVKEHAEQLRALINRIEQTLIQQPENDPASVVTSPLRWLSEGRTDLQKGFMCVIRAIAQPTTF